MKKCLKVAGTRFFRWKCWKKGWFFEFLKVAGAEWRKKSAKRNEEASGRGKKEEKGIIPTLHSSLNPTLGSRNVV